MVFLSWNWRRNDILVVAILITFSCFVLNTNTKNYKTLCNGTIKKSRELLAAHFLTLTFTCWEIKGGYKEREKKSTHSDLLSEFVNWGIKEGRLNYFAF